MMDLYECFCAEVLWPILHCIPTEFNLTDLVKQFDAYTFVNQLYLEKV